MFVFVFVFVSVSVYEFAIVDVWRAVCVSVWEQIFVNPPNHHLSFSTTDLMSQLMFRQRSKIATIFCPQQGHIFLQLSTVFLQLSIVFCCPLSSSVNCISLIVNVFCHQPKQIFLWLSTWGVSFITVKVGRNLEKSSWAVGWVMPSISKVSRNQSTSQNASQQDTGCFFAGPPPKKLKYGKQRLGEVRCI